MTGAGNEREHLLAALREDSADPEAAHIDAEKKLMQWLETFDEELANAWKTAREEQCWWYA